MEGLETLCGLPITHIHTVFFTALKNRISVQKKECPQSDCNTELCVTEIVNCVFYLTL